MEFGYNEGLLRKSLHTSINEGSGKPKGPQSHALNYPLDAHLFRVSRVATVTGPLWVSFYKGNICQ